MHGDLHTSQNAYTNITIVSIFVFKEIEQDRHRLRRQLAQARAECEQRCHELQADLRDLQAVLDSRERQLREADKQKRAVVRELTDQNGRLQSHIREVCTLSSGEMTTNDRF